MTQANAHASHSAHAPARWYVPEAMAAWFVPGLGHFLIGEKRRGIILLLCISSLWFGGLLLGGPGIVDWHSQSAPIVRIGQYGLFQTFAFEWFRKNYMTPVPADLKPGELAADSLTIHYRQSFNRLEEQGVLFAAIAGMLNIMALLDVVHRSPPGSGSDEQDDASAGGTSGGISGGGGGSGGGGAA